MKNTYPLDNYYSTLPRFSQVNSDELISGMDCQRKINRKHVNDIVENFDPKLFTPPTVVYENGKYSLFDGQHRVAALVQMNHGEPVSVYCLVFRGNYADGAYIVSKQNDGHLRQSSYACINAAAEAGDKTAKEFLSVNEQLGVHFVGDGKQNKYLFQSTHSLYTLFKKYGTPAYVRVLSLITQTWGNNQGAHDARFVKAAFAFDAKYKNYKNSVFRNRFADADVQRLITNTRSLNMSTTDGLLTQMVGIYNKGQRENTRL